MSEAARPARAVPAARLELAATAAVFALALAVYLASPVRKFLDPRFTLLASESLVTRGSWDLSPYFENGRPARRAWQVRTVTRTLLTSNETNFRVRADLDAYEGPSRVFSRSWDTLIPRNLL